MTITSSLKRMADSFISKQGQSCSVVFVTSVTSDYDPTGNVAVVAPTVVSVATKGIFLDYAILSHGNKSKYGTVVEEGDKELYLTMTSSFPRLPNPDLDYIIDSAGVKWIIKSVKENNPDGVNQVMLNCLIRK